MARPVVLNDSGTALGLAFKGLAKEVVQKAKAKATKGKPEKAIAFKSIEDSIRAEIETESNDLI